MKIQRWLTKFGLHELKSYVILKHILIIMILLSNLKKYHQNPCPNYFNKIFMHLPINHTFKIL